MQIKQMHISVRGKLLIVGSTRVSGKGCPSTIEPWKALMRAMHRYMDVLY